MPYWSKQESWPDGTRKKDKKEGLSKEQKKRRRERRRLEVTICFLNTLAKLDLYDRDVRIVGGRR